MRSLPRQRYSLDKTAAFPLCDRFNGEFTLSSGRGGLAGSGGGQLEEFEGCGSAVEANGADAVVGLGSFYEDGLVV